MCNKKNKLVWTEDDFSSLALAVTRLLLILIIVCVFAKIFTTSAESVRLLDFVSIVSAATSIIVGVIYSGFKASFTLIKEGKTKDS